MDTLRKPLTDTANSASKLPKPKGIRLPGVKRERSPAAFRDVSHEETSFQYPAEPTKKKLKFEAPSVPAANHSRVASSRNVSRVTSSRLQTSRIQSSRAPLVANPRRETMPARPHTVLNSTVAKPGQRGAVSVRPNLSISPIQGNNKKKAVKKRPVWDLKGRIQDMEEQLKDKDSLMVRLDQMMIRIDDLEIQKEDLAGTVLKKEELATTVSKEVDDLRYLLRQKEEEIFEQNRKFQRDLDDLKFSKSNLERQKETLEAELNAKTQEIAALKTSIAQQSSAQATLRAELDVSKLGLDNANQQLCERDLEIDRLKKVIQQHEATIDDNTQRMREHETVRRKLHNTIQELKGNIRVFCRVRPLIGEEIQSHNGVISHINFPDLDARILELDHLVNNGLNESLSTSNVGKNKKKHEFSFDKVFSPDSTQKDVFDEISQLVQSALDGYNVCIFAYGQTGSGKTYTMEGKDIQDVDDMGMIPRATMQVFETAEVLKEKGWTYEFEAIFLEIYNETIRDLLGDKDDLKHEIKMATDKSNSVHVTNLTTVHVKSRAQIHNLLAKASHRRAVGETKLNVHSSRSHSVFKLILKGSNEQTGESCHGSLNLVDLAGSERLKDSGSEGKRLKETQAINKSLSNLGAVFTSLANKENHIPYRNSKLTYLLQNSLGGNSKTLMFVNVSPREDNFNETLNSLRFATAVNNCNIGTAQKRVK